MPRFSFDKAYYDRFYGDDAGSRVISERERKRLGRFLAAYLDHLDLPIETVLDAGCGTGEWQGVIQKEFRRAEYTGLEVSSYVCEQHGWIQGSVVDWAPEETFDLVLCQGVLQYLSARDANRALRNLAQWTHHALFLEALTEADWQENCDRDATDGNVFLRSADWYRERLQPHFLDCGGGLFVKRDAGVALFELESRG